MERNDRRGRKINVGNQIRNYRKGRQFSQEDLAEKVFVSRQTISNWETEKSYPDLQSLLLLTTLFDISLDELIKGDVEKMKENVTVKAMERDSKWMPCHLFLLFMTLPLAKRVSLYFLLATVVFFGAMLYYAFRLEKMKKAHDVATYKEILAFMEGKPLASIHGKRRQKKLLLENLLKVLGGIIVGGVFSGPLLFFG